MRINFPHYFVHNPYSVGGTQNPESVRILYSTTGGKYSFLLQFEGLVNGPLCVEEHHHLAESQVHTKSAKVCNNFSMHSLLRIRSFSRAELIVMVVHFNGKFT
jgi:hypothetical protein